VQKTALSVGSQIEVRCPKCRKNRDHEIVSIADGKPSKVQCVECKHQRKYRPPVTQKTAEEKLLIKNIENRQRKNMSEQQQWTALRPNLDSSKALDYSMSAKYKNKDLVNHPVFGLGLVQRVIGSQKVEILFEEGVKIMRCQ